MHNNLRCNLNFAKSIKLVYTEAMKRPTHKELSSKIREAQSCATDERIMLLNPASIAADALDLGYMMEDLSAVLQDVLAEITPENYVGLSPPQKSYENQINGADLFPFRWKSLIVKCLAYLKFAMATQTLWLISFHPNRKAPF